MRLSTFIVCFMATINVSVASDDDYDFCGYLECKSNHQPPDDAKIELWDWDMFSQHDIVARQEINSTAGGYFHIQGIYSDGWPESNDWFFKIEYWCGGIGGDFYKYIGPWPTFCDDGHYDFEVADI